MHPLSLAIITPVLGRDVYLEELAHGMAVLRGAGLECVHIIVHACPLIDIKDLFPGAVFLAEGVRAGVFAAVAQGFDYAINLGVSHIGYINSDDCLLTGYLDFWRYAGVNESDINVARVCWLSEGGRVDCLVAGWPCRSGMLSLFHQAVPPFTQQGVIMKSTVWTALEGFNVRYRYIADTVFWARTLEVGCSYSFYSKVVAGYRLRCGQLSGNRVDVDYELRAWLSGVRLPGFLRGFALLTLFRIYNIKLYINRFIGCKSIRSLTATKSGGFKV